MSIVIYVLMIWLSFFLLNYAEIAAKPAAWLKKLLGPKWGYPLSCALCYCWWISVPFWFFGWLTFPMLCAAPVLHLFVDLSFHKLNNQCPPRL